MKASLVNVNTTFPPQLHLSSANSILLAGFGLAPLFKCATDSIYPVRSNIFSPLYPRRAIRISLRQAGGLQRTNILNKLVIRQE